MQFETFSFPPSSVGRLLGSSTDDLDLRVGRLVPPSGPITRLWLRTAQTLTAEVLQRPEFYRSDIIRESAIDAVLSVTIDAFDLTDADETDAATTDRALERAEAFMQANLGRPISIPEVARAIGISVRGLQLAYRTRNLGTPLLHFRQMRMHAAHHRLMVADATTTVATVAQQLTYTNVGRFSAHYRAAFGENPPTHSAAPAASLGDCLGQEDDESSPYRVVAVSSGTPYNSAEIALASSRKTWSGRGGGLPDFFAPSRPVESSRQECDAVMQSEQQRTTQPVVADRYALGEELGRGGRAIVYAASDTLLGRQVAIKVFHADAGRAEEMRIQENEARLAASMNHYALTTLFDAGIDVSRPDAPRIYLVMERIVGQDLRQRLRRQGPLTVGQVACLGFDLSEALQVMHEHGFLHRDIKPANVLIADRDLTTHIRGKLTDFGISSTIGAPEASNEVTGSAAYLSPEQVDGQPATTASDVYSLGLVLLEALTGRVAYPGGVEESAFARLDFDPEIPSDIPDPIASVLRSMTSLEPEDRPSLTEVTMTFLTAYVQHLFDVGRVNETLLVPEERLRLAAVREYRILDTPADEAFDRLVKLACRLLDVPIALLAIVDAERAWFKATRGGDLESVDRNIALCARTVTTG